MIYEVVKSILFYLDTSKRSGGTIGSPQFVFPNNLIGLQPQAGEKLRLTMQEASINYTFYQTETFNNKFVVEEKVAGGQVVSRVVETAIGNYNLSTFILEITSKLTQGGLYGYAVTFNNNTNTLNFVASPKNGATADSVVFNFDPVTAKEATGVDLQESSNEIMGFAVGSRNTLTVAGGGREITSTIPISMSPGVENLFVTIKNQSQNYGSTDQPNVFSASNVLAKIPVAGVPYGTLYFFDLNGNFSTIIDNKYLDNLNIKLLNERLTPIEPRKNWTFTVKLEVIRPKVEEKMNEAMQELLELTRLKFLKKSENTQKETEIKNIV